MIADIGISMLFLFASYLVVTFIGIVHTTILGRFFNMGGPRQKGPKSPAYQATVPYHPLYNALIFPLFAWLYLHNVRTTELWHLALSTAVTWTLVSIFIDYVGWVLIPHPFRLSHKEFYIDYQPWITLIYIIIFISPFIAGTIKGI